MAQIFEKFYGLSLDMMKITVLACDVQYSTCAYPTITRCLLAILFYSCNPSSSPERPNAHDTTVRRGNATATQQDDTISTSAQTAGGELRKQLTDVVESASHIDRAMEQRGTTAQGDDRSSTQHSTPPLDSQEILARKLSDPRKELSAAEGISLITYCAQLGEENAASATGKEVVLVLGNTGVGKSTAVNYLMGCEMKLVKPSELGLEGSKRVVIVNAEGTRPEVMPIGHGSQSHTLMPQIVPDADDSNQAYCDCPGFSDNRGAEINIANAINTRRVLQQATGVKAVFLVSYYGLHDDRGAGVMAMEHMCYQMFGGVNNLRRHQDSVLLGITKAPLYEGDKPLTRSMVQELLTCSEEPITQILASRVFLFDPLDRGRDNPEFWPRARCRAAIAQLSSIPQRKATTLFQTVLTDSDQIKLKHIMRAQVSALASSLGCDDYPSAERCWQSLEQLDIIDSAEVAQMLREYVEMPLIGFVLRRVEAYRESARQHKFDEAECQLELLRRLLGHFPHKQLEYGLEGLEEVLRNSREKRRMEEEMIRQNLEEARCEATERAAKKASDAADKADKALNQQVEQFKRKVEKVKDRGGDKCCMIS